MDDDYRPIVVDNGSGSMKAGFAGDEVPTCVFSAIVGRPRHVGVMVGLCDKDCYVGDAAQEARGALKITYPIEHGVVVNWDDLEKIWQHTFFNELRVDPSEHPVLLTEAPLNPRFNREKMVEIMFETFKVPGTYVSVQAILALYASGRTTGVVLDCGDGVTHVVPIFEGYCAPLSVKRLDIAGRDLTEYLTTLVSRSKYAYNQRQSNMGHAFRSTAEREIVRDMKEKVCQVALNFDDEMKRTDEQLKKLAVQYTLPDGAIVELDTERIECPEILFQPAILGYDEPGIHELVYNSIKKCDRSLQSRLFDNIVLSGGTTMLPNFKERLTIELKDLKAKVGDTLPVDVSAPSGRKYFVWIGGSTLAALNSFQKMWVTRDEFEECGPNILNRKCF